MLKIIEKKIEIISLENEIKYLKKHFIFKKLNKIVF